jgi:hypothetical protein
VKTFDMRVVTSTGEVLMERLGVTYSMPGAGAGDMVRALVWQSVHPDETVSLIVNDADTGEQLLTFQMVPPEGRDDA